jgi:lysophospholipase L1-like esterase
MKHVWLVPKNFLERLSDPTSRFHPDYLAYRRGEITKSELIARLPHVAMIGDSVCTGIHISTPWKTFRRACSCRGRDWFLNVDPATGIESVSKRLEKLTPLVASHHGGIGAMVDAESDRLWFSRRILGTRNLSGQINQLVTANRFPDLILISIGHNNVDWAWRSPADELVRPEVRLQRLSQSFREMFECQLRELVVYASEKPQRISIIVFGLVNFGSYFQGREEAERRRAKDSALYPHLEKTYNYLISFRPALRGNVIRLAEMMNHELRMMIDDLNRGHVANENIQLRYSDALATADLSRAELLHAVDGWHASVAGHNVLAEAAFADLAPSLKFLGIV